MTSFVTSQDGTRIAYDRLGDGPPLVVVSGLFCDRSVTRELSERLSADLTVANYDRRGRGDSGDTAPYAVQREIEDLAAVVEALGGKAAVYGHSSGAGLAVLAAAAGVPFSALVLHEPPYSQDDERSRHSAQQLSDAVRTAVAEHRHADAIGLFLSASGMPQEVVAQLSLDPRMLAVAPTMPYDFAVMGDDRGAGVVPEDLVRSVTAPTLLLVGSTSPPFFHDAAGRLLEMLPDATYAVLEGHDHGAPPHVVAPVVAEFLTRR